MVVSAGWLLIIGGLCACSPLFKRVSKALERFLAIIGLLIGIVVLIVAVDYGLALNYLSSVIQIPTPAALPSTTYLKYFLPAMIILGILLVSRPIKNIRWASLISLAVGLLVPYFLVILVPSLITNTTILVIVFLIAAVAIYTLLKFVEDIFKLVSSILAFTPIALVIGLVNIYFGVLLVTT